MDDSAGGSATLLLLKVGDDDTCREYLERLRWPEGVCCPRCGDRSVSEISTRHQLDCNGCRYRFSVTSGTIFDNTKLPLRKWFVAIYLMLESEERISANQLKDALGISYKTSWHLCHRIREAMGNEEEEGNSERRTRLSGFPQVSAKHRERYAEELEWRLENRGNPLIFRDLLIRLLDRGALRYQSLTA